MDARPYALIRTRHTHARGGAEDPQHHLTPRKFDRKYCNIGAIPAQFVPTHPVGTVPRARHCARTQLLRRYSAKMLCKLVRPSHGACRDIKKKRRKMNEAPLELKIFIT